MSKFKKLLYTLIFILLVEACIIYIGYIKNTKGIDTINLAEYNPKKLGIELIK